MAEIDGYSVLHSKIGKTLGAYIRGVWGDSNAGYGVVGTSDDTYGVYGASDTTQGVAGVAGTGKTGVEGWGDYYGVYGAGGVGPSDNAIAGVYGQVFGSAPGVIGFNAIHIGVHGEGAIGVSGLSDDGTGVSGLSDDGTGVYGKGGDSDFGVYGESNNAGVYGNSSKNVGVYATGGDTGVVAIAGSDKGYGIRASGWGVGLYAENSKYPNGFGVEDWPAAYLGTQTVAGGFYGGIYVYGMITKFGGGFQIDDPRDPANKFLSHSFVESSDMKNIYDGVTVLDSGGKAEIKLPDWFDEINGDFRYQLTAIGSAGPNLYIKEEISKNRFKIAGGSPGMKVSWQVTGIRKDPWANSNRIKVEQKKSSKERGYYLTPELFNESSDKNIRWAHYPRQKRQFQKIKDMNKVKMERLKDMTKRAMKDKMKKIKDMNKVKMERLKDMKKRAMKDKMKKGK